MRTALESLPWARNAKIDFPKRQATVTVTTARYSEAALLEALVDAGFGGRVATAEARVQPVKSPPGVRITFRVSGMKKAKSGAT